MSAHAPGLAVLVMVTTACAAPVPHATTAPGHAARADPPAPIAVGVLFDPSMSQTRVGLVVWDGVRRRPIVEVGRMLGDCAVASYPSLAGATRAANLVLGVGCTSQGLVEDGGRSVVEIVREGDALVVRTARLHDRDAQRYDEQLAVRVPVATAATVSEASRERMDALETQAPPW